MSNPRTFSGRVFVAVFVLAASSLRAELTAIRTSETLRIGLGETPWFEAGALVFAPKFAWMGGMRQEPQTKDGVSVFSTSFQAGKSSGVLNLTEMVAAEGDRLSIRVRAASDSDLPLTYAAMAFAPKRVFEGGEAEVFTADGDSRKLPIPMPRGDATAVEKIIFRGLGGETATLTIDPPLDAHIDGAFRLKVAGDKIAAGQEAKAGFSLVFGQPLVFYPSPTEVPDPTDTASWFPFEPKNDTEPGALGMRSWMAIPSQVLKIDGDRVLADGKPFKVWGTNTEYAANKPDAKTAAQAASWFAKYGVNTVRLHKLSNPGWEGLGSKTSAADYDAADLRLFDNFTAELRGQGVLYGFSPIWNLTLFDADRERFVAYDEIKAAGRNETTGLVWFMKDVQDLHIEKLTKLLDHRNEVTGRRYAEEPALAFVEIQNEEDAFWFIVIPRVLQFPTYKRLLAEQFTDWLAKRYGTQEKLAQAWGAALDGMHGDGGNAGESLEARNILPIGNPWFLDNQIAGGVNSQRLRDTAEFLLESQNNFYRRATEAIRATGYEGPIIASNWQAGEKTGHFLNLWSDAQFGIVDRHNYLAGAAGQPDHIMATGFSFFNSTSLSDPGSALLSTGMQQVAGHPFSISEWLAIPPLEWAAAETAIIAIYGMGLQGWDMSYFFASNGDGFSPTLEYPGDKKFNNLTAHGIGMFPVLSRMVLRGDIREGDVVANRRLSLNQALLQTYDFTNKTVQGGDLKSFTGTPGHHALAVGRVLIDFTKEDSTSEIRNLDSQRGGDTWTSTTGQLRWTAPGGHQTGFITVVSAGTQGVLGFAPPKPQELGQLTITPQDRYSVVMATAMEPDRDLSNCDEALLLAISRVRNTGMKLGHGLILDMGKAPTILEPVKATIEFKRTPKSVTALDADGHPREGVVNLQGRVLQLDTGEHKSIYYLVKF
jgi:hypothetical protein